MDYCERKVFCFFLQAIWHDICQAWGFFYVLKTHPSTIFGDVLKDETIVLLTLALHEYHSVAVTRQLLLHF